MFIITAESVSDYFMGKAGEKYTSNARFSVWNLGDENVHKEVLKRSSSVRFG